jgi:hypothetical protein
MKPKTQRITLDKRIFRFLTAMFAVTLVLSTCSGCKLTGRQAWEKVIIPCAGTDAAPAKNMVYFGPSNAIGPGSVWRESEAGGYNLRGTASEITNTTVEQLVVLGQEFTCGGSETTTLRVDPSVFVTAIGTIDSELNAELKNVSQLEASMKGVATDNLREATFENFIMTLPESNTLRRDLLRNDRLVMTKAIRVRGLQAKINLSESSSARLKSKFPTGSVIANELGASLKVEWTGESQLTLSTDDSKPIYIAASFSRYVSGQLIGAAGAGHYGEFRPVNPSVDTVIVSKPSRD